MLFLIVDAITLNTNQNVTAPWWAVRLQYSVDFVQFHDSTIDY